ncbi:MAG TPA: DUF885 domain-containing protein, partial [Vicinamibacteria bacterium]|nr:DUF885 domain-containing protein [Vicinamibacteria bacterium]
MLILPVVLALMAPAAGPAADLDALFKEEWELRLRENPLQASGVGDHRYDDRLPSVTAADRERRAKAQQAFLERASRIDRAALSRADRINYDMWRRELEDDLMRHRFGAHRIPILADTGFHISFADLPTRAQLVSVRDYESYIARLRAFPAYMDQQIANMREGLGAGFTQPQVILEGYEGTISAHVVDDVQKSVFMKPFARFPVGVPEAERGRLAEAGRGAVAEAVVPAYRRFLEFMTKEYIPGARKTTGASDLPDGRAYYDALVKSFTTLDVTPEQVHEIGKKEVARIEAEMQAVMKETGYTGDFASFLTFLRTDPRFYAKTPQELLKEASFIAKKMDAKLPSLFGTLPRLPYGVEPVPDSIAPKFTGGRYVPAPPGGVRAGTYWVNTYDLPSRPLYVLESLTLHEAVPGHHLQNALQREMTGLPDFRRFAQVGAFGEGWGLYSERLGLEAGFYQDPHSNFGRLTYEMWRACRLVVDTGLHALGWSRQQAMDYLASHTALSLHEVRTETDRYIAWPGQALSYKMGELKIRELRTRAEKELG